MRSMRIFSLILMFLVAGTHFGLNAQTVPDKRTYDFGQIFRHSERFVDFYFKNTGEKKSFFLRLDKIPDITYQISSSTLMPDSSIAIRFQVNPTKKGKFSYSIPTYFSDINDPITITLKGEVMDLFVDNSTAFQNCPDFTQQPADGNPLDFTLTVVTVEKGSGKVLSKSDVALLQNGLVVGQWKTDRNGQVVKRVPLGYSYFYATHEGYSPAELGAYINFRRNYVVLELERSIEEIPIIAEEIPVVVNEEIVAEVVIKEEPKEIKIEIEEVIPVKEVPELSLEIEESKTIETTIPALAEVPLENFDPTLFKPNNIVFVLDVSTSMRAGDRFELMKYALYQLMEYIRPQDNIALVTYGSDARIVLKTTSGADKEKMIEEVKNLKASGFTAGGKGIKLGYDLAKKGYIPNGNNQIIVITDGAFNRDSDDYDRTVKRFTKEGYILSVAGIKNAPADEEKMREVAEQGNGRYVPIFKLSDAQWNLIKEMREASFIGK